jgi:hypothetical protein
LRSSQQESSKKLLKVEQLPVSHTALTWDSVGNLQEYKYWEKSAVYCFHQVLVGMPKVSLRLTNNLLSMQGILRYNTQSLLLRSQQLKEHNLDCTLKYLFQRLYPKGYCHLSSNLLMLDFVMETYFQVNRIILGTKIYTSTITMYVFDAFASMLLRHGKKHNENKDFLSAGW